ncbi:MAG: TonB-dependent receptor [Gammaproteobacteria bacterium]|nr:TonB-dependent receptor [Gammaproteobacteria bacterium]
MQRKLRWGRLLSLPAMAATLAIAVPAGAAVEEIIVTTRKIEEELKDVPVAVSAFTTDRIAELNIKSIDDLAKFTPSFSFTSAFGRQPGSDRPAIRGVTTVVNGIANSSAVGYFVDGVYLPGSPQSTELFNLERVEIIKGPQAAQFGRGTYAGAINYITRSPSMDALEGGFTGTGAEHETWEASGWASGPIIQDELAFYVAAGYDTYGGEFDNQATGDEVGGTETTSLTGKLLWEPLENLSVTLKGGVQQTDDDHFAIYLQPRTLNNCFFRTPDAPRSREYFCGKAVVDENGLNLATQLLENAEDGLSGVELDRYLGSLVVEYGFADGYTFTSTTGYIKDEVETGFDVSYANYDPVPFGSSIGSFFQLDDDESETWTQELRVNSPQDRPLRWTGGLYFLSIEDTEEENRKVLPSGVAALQTVANLTEEKVDNWAVFGGIDWDVTEATTVGLEARYAEDEVEVINTVNDGSGTREPCGPNPSCKDTFDSFTPRLTVRHALTDEANLYGSVAWGTKPGDFNATVPEVNGQPDESFRDVDEEEMVAYEVGVKADWLDRQLRTNAAIYFNDIDDQQLTTNIEGPGGVPQSVLANVGKTEVWGIELEADFSVTENWSGGVMYAWTDSEIKERISTDEADLRGGNGTLEEINTFGDVSGNDSPRIPDHQFALRGRYDRPTPWGSWYAGADFTFESSKWAQEHNLIETGDRELLGARVGAIWGNWEFTLWGKNLTDDDTPLDILRYIDRRTGTLTSCTALPPSDPATVCTGSSTSARGFALTLQPGRQVGGTVSYRFGG